MARRAQAAAQRAAQAEVQEHLPGLYPVKEPLGQLAKRFNIELSRVGTSPLRLAWELRSVVLRWEEEYRAEADGLSAASWITQNLGYRYDFWENRWRAVELMGLQICSCMSDRSAVLVLRFGVPKGYLGRVVEHHARFKRTQGFLMPYHQTRALLHRMFGRPGKRQLEEPVQPCEICQLLRGRILELEKLLRRKGIRIPEWDHAEAMKDHQEE